VGQYPDIFKVACMRNPVVNIPAMQAVTDIPGKNAVADIISRYALWTSRSLHL
jgi:hypothetical protein